MIRSKPPRGRRVLSRRESQRLIARVREYVATSSELARTIGCSPRTARRLLSTPVESIPRLRRSYAQQASDVLNVPIAALCGTGIPSNFVTGWDGAADMIQARQRVSELVTHVSAFATLGFGVRSSYEVVFGVDGFPSHAKVIVEAVPGRQHQLIFRDPDGRLRETELSYFGVGGLQIYKGKSTETAITKILKHIQHECRSANHRP